MPGRSARNTKSSPDSTRSMAGIQRRMVPPLTPLPPVPGPSKTVVNRRFISDCRVPSSRSGSQRTMVMAVAPPVQMGFLDCGRVCDLSRRLSSISVSATEIRHVGGPRHGTVPPGRHLLELAGLEVAQEPLPDAFQVRRARLLEDLLAAIGQHGEAAAAVGVAGVAHEQAVALQAIDQA